MKLQKVKPYITLFIAKFNSRTRELQYVNAGHNPSILISNHDEIEYLEDGCTLLGVLETLPNIKSKSLSLQHPFLVFGYTDGLTELENERNEFIQIPALAKVIQANQHREAKEINQQVIAFVNSFRGTRPLNDDVSLLTCKIF